MSLLAAIGGALGTVPPVSLDDVPGLLSDVEAGGAALASLTLASDGDIDTHDGDVGDWISPRGAASAWAAQRYAYMTVNSGSLTSGTTGSAVAISTSPQWTISQGSVGTNSANVTLQIRDAGGTVLDEKTFDIEAERTA